MTHKFPDQPLIQIQDLLASRWTIVTDYDDSSGEFRLAVRGIVKDGKPHLGLAAATLRQRGVIA